MKLMAQMGDEARAVLFAQAREGGWSAARALSRSPGPFREEGRQIAEEYGQRSNEEYLHKEVARFLSDGQALDGDAVQALMERLRDPSCAKRRIAVDLLVELGAKETAGEVAKLAGDERWAVRASVARALHKWGACGEVLEELRRDPDIIVRGCALYVS